MTDTLALAASDLDTLADQLADTYQETRPRVRKLFRAVVAALGRERTLEIQVETARIEAAGGQLIDKGTRRRTPGGVFLRLARQALPDRSDLFPFIKADLPPAIILRYGADWPGMTEAAYRQLLAARIEPAVVGFCPALVRAAWDGLGLAGLLDTAAAVIAANPATHTFGKLWLTALYDRLPAEARAQIAPPAFPSADELRNARLARKAARPAAPPAEASQPKPAAETRPTQPPAASVLPDPPPAAFVLPDAPPAPPEWPRHVNVSDAALRALLVEIEFPALTADQAAILQAANVTADQAREAARLAASPAGLESRNGHLSTAPDILAYTCYTRLSRDKKRGLPVPAGY